MSGDNYVDIECKVLVVTNGAVLLQTPDVEEWCPRSCLHGGSDIKARDASPADLLTLKIRRWKAKEMGLT